MSKKLKEKVKTTPLFWRIEKAMLYGAVAIQTAMLPMVVHANALEETKLVQGTKNLLSAATAVMVGIEAAVVIFLEIKTGIQWQLAETEEKPKHIKNMKTIGIGGVIVMCISGIVPVIFSYYI